MPGDEAGKEINGVTYHRFDANDNPVTSDNDDVCGKRVSSCECRFGKKAGLPFGSFPAAGLTK